MSMMKRYFEEHYAEFSNEELLAGGYSQEEIDFMGECFVGKDYKKIRKEKVNDSK